jgi:hypothetical protein
MGILSTRRLKRCLERMPLPAPFTVEALAANMAELSGRSIELHMIDEPAVHLWTACGLRARVDGVTHIFYRPRPTENQRQHTILHELAHEWLDHGTTLSPQQLRTLAPPRLLQSLSERLGPDAVIQARARYETVEEQEAELAASLIKDIVRSRVGGGDDFVSLLETTLSHPVASMRRPRKKAGRTR